MQCVDHRQSLNGGNPKPAVWSNDAIWSANAGLGRVKPVRTIKHFIVQRCTRSPDKRKLLFGDSDHTISTAEPKSVIRSLDHLSQTQRAIEKCHFTVSNFTDALRQVCRIQITLRILDE